VQQGIISDEEYESAVQRSEQSGHSLWKALRDANLIIPGHARPRDQDARQTGLTPAPGGGGPSGISTRPITAPDQFASIPTLVSELFEDTVRWRATDIHFDPTPGGVRIRVRIDGLLHDVGTLPEEVARQVRSRIKVLAGMDLLEKREPQDGHISLRAEDGHRDFRVATLLTGVGERMVVRFHQVADWGRSLDDLGLEGEQVAAVRRLLANPQGLILVAGPIGSGKTTTLYACLREQASPTRSLITIEDPIEYQLDGVTQVEVRPKLGLSLARGLRAILRQDPDVIMVGEIRDRDTARIASRAASIGSVVLSSLHAADGRGVFRSLANLGVAPQRIGESLAGIVVQRLVRTLCSACKRPVDLDRELKSQLVRWGLSNEEADEATLFGPTGCPDCLGTGYRGRTGVFEVIELGERMRQRGRPSGDGLSWSHALAEGRSCDLSRSAARKVGQGLTTIEEIRRILPMQPGTPSESAPTTSLAGSVAP